MRQARAHIHFGRADRRAHCNHNGEAVHTCFFGLSLFWQRLLVVFGISGTFLEVFVLKFAGGVSRVFWKFFFVFKGESPWISSFYFSAWFLLVFSAFLWEPTKVHYSTTQTICFWKNVEVQVCLLASNKETPCLRVELTTNSLNIPKDMSLCLILPMKNWKATLSSALVFHQRHWQVSLRYQPGLPLALFSISFELKRKAVGWRYTWFCLRWFFIRVFIFFCGFYRVFGFA